MLKIYPTLVDSANALNSEQPVSEDMNKYVEVLINNIENSNRQSRFRLCRESTEVSNLAIASVNLFEKDTEQVEQNFEAVANRFLRCEVQAREKVEKMNVVIQNGCLIQAIIKEDNAKYKYLIAKCDWNTFLNKTNFSISEGLQINKKSLGKSCIFYIEKKETITITECKVLLDNQANYFWKEFLELEKINSNESSTENAVKKVLATIDKHLKRSYPKCRQNLRNSFVTYLQGRDFVDYNEMLDDVFKPYLEKMVDSHHAHSLMEELHKLPDRGQNKFDRQFTCIHDKIKAKNIQSRYVLDSHIFLEIQDNYDDEEIAKIVSGIEIDKRTYIKIYTDDKSVLSTFEEDKTV